MENRRHLKNLSEARELKLAQKSVEMPIKCSNKYADVQSKFYRDMEASALLRRGGPHPCKAHVMVDIFLCLV